ncbi:hypothetical protein TNCV_3609431 [Trichonephila clavipes]|nr:hypothetical protein TNCV_3609431 [Trichonephila clavipes]
MFQLFFHIATTRFETLVVSWDQLSYPSVVELCHLCEWNQRVTDVFRSSSLPKRSSEDRNFLRCEKMCQRDQGCRVDDETILSRIPLKQLPCVEPYVDEHCHE